VSAPSLANIVGRVDLRNVERVEVIRRLIEYKPALLGSGSPTRAVI
jgi:hypothetical protein